jgi:hypothetical protein
MGNLFRKEYLVLYGCIAGIILTFILVPDWAQKLLVIFTIALFFVAVQQSYSAQSSAQAAKISAQTAADSHRQATYIHLATLWYQIKQRGLESENFISPEFTSLFRQEEIWTKYRQYHVYAWMCWGHAEDCYSTELHTDVGFLPTLVNYKELHWAWLTIPKNRSMFGNEFLQWIEKSYQPQVEIRSDKTPEGKGVFATTEFTNGAFIGFFDGKLVKNRTQMSLQFGRDFHVEPSDETPFRHLNHSCDANSRFLGRNIYAWRDIHPGEEITIDYNCNEWELVSPFKCNCRSTACLGQIKGFKYLTEEQKRQRNGMICSWVRDDFNQQNG